MRFECTRQTDMNREGMKVSVCFMINYCIPPCVQGLKCILAATLVIVNEFIPIALDLVKGTNFFLVLLIIFTKMLSGYFSYSSTVLL